MTLLYIAIAAGVGILLLVGFMRNKSAGRASNGGDTSGPGT
jgi:hypothetical protein